ncbi:MAG: sugar phosphate nucleotidyltransferase [Candidatus Woesebacteria bacterium]|jgi:bifunctional UDP-N-acetylglucosamine pyrophosphorylase/glucosamine-1-phosphate N-acetyltransferase
MPKQAVLLAAGKSSRFFPFSIKESKVETVLMGKPILYWTLDSLIEAKIKKVVVVVNQSNSRTKSLLKDYVQNFEKLEIAIQKEARGMADAILAAKDLLDEHFFVMNASQVNAADYLQKMINLNSSSALAATATDNPKIYGVVSIEGVKAISLIEKPQQKIKNPYRIIGIYLLNRDFLNYMSSLPAEEYLLETALNNYMQKHEVKVAKFEKTPASLKYPWHLLDLKNELFQKFKFSISKQAKISPTALIKGDVYIGPEAIVADYAIVEGPAYIGKKAVVGQHCILRKGSVLEDRAEVQRFADVANSILMTDAHCHSGFIGDSVLGQGVRIGAGFISANRRLDRATVKTVVKAKKTDSKRKNLGVIMGHNVKVGVQSSTMPGVIIKNEAVIEPGSIIKKNINQ